MADVWLRSQARSRNDRSSQRAGGWNGTWRVGQKRVGARVDFREFSAIYPRSTCVTRASCAGISVCSADWASGLSFSAGAARRRRGRGGCLGVLEGDCGSPFRGMDSAQRPELSFLRFAQRRLIRPPRAGVISPSDQRQDGKRNRKGERNHEPSYHDVWAMENCISAHKY